MYNSGIKKNNNKILIGLLLCFLQCIAIAEYAYANVRFSILINNSKSAKGFQIGGAYKVNSSPDTPTLSASTTSICESGALKLSAKSSGAAVIYWSDNYGNTSTGTTWEFLTVNKTTIYTAYATENGLSSTSASITVTVISTPTLKISVSPTNICDSGLVTYTANTNGATIKWYKNDDDQLLSSANPYNRHLGSSSDNFLIYAIATTNNCPSKKVTTQANFTYTPFIDTYHINTKICIGGSATLTASPATSAEINWYTSLTGVTPIYKGYTFNTPPLSANTNYYIEASKNGCASKPRKVVDVIVMNVQISSITPGSRCGSGSVKLSAASSTGAGIFKWYTQVTGGIEIGTGSTIITPNIQTTTKYYVALTDVACTTPRVEVTATIIKEPEILTQPLNTNGCSNSTVKFEINASGINLTYQWQAETAPNTFTNINNDATFSGTNTPVLTVIIGTVLPKLKYKCIIGSDCSSITSTDAVLTVNNDAFISLHPVTVNSCTSSTAVFKVVASGGSLNYQWEMDAGNGFVNVPNSTPYIGVNTASLTVDKVPDLFAGYKYRCFVSSTVCKTAIRSAAAVLNVNKIVAANAGNNQTLCAVSAGLIGNNPASGKGVWRVLLGGGIIADSSKETTTITKLTGGKNLLTWTITLGACTSTDSLLLTVSSPPTKAFAGNDQNVCEDNATLTAKIPTVGNGIWAKIAGVGNITDSTKFNTKITGLVLGQKSTFVWIVSKANCTSSYDTVHIDYTTLSANVNAGVNQQVCKDSATLTASSKYTGSGKWQVILGKATILQAPNDTTLVTGLSMGENKFMRILSSNCGLAIDTVIVTRNDKLSKAFAGNDEEICGKKLKLTAHPPTVGVGKWTVAGGNAYFNNDADPNTTVSNLSQGNNVLRWTITSGTCPSSIDEVVINCLPPSDPNCENLQVSIPTGFSPNGDGINDKLILKGLEKYPGSVLRIYNQLGDLVYEKQNYENDWEAISNVKGVLVQGKLPTGTYSFILI